MKFFQFEDPWFLVLAIFLPALILLRGNKNWPTIGFSSVKLIKQVDSGQGRYLSKIPLVLWSMAAIFFALALARPQEGHKTTEILTRGVDIVMAIDVSGSMQALDFSQGEEHITRLDAVRDVVSGFIDRRENDRMGMVVFGAEAYTQCPLTLDRSILQSFLQKLEIGMAGDATAIGSAIGVSVKRLKDLQSKSKIIILLTDGLSNAGSITPLQAAEIAKTFDIKIHSIGVGTMGKAPFLVDSFLGPQYVYQDVEIDEETLRKVSEMSGGKYYRATDRESLKSIYDEIDQMEKSEVKTIDHSEYTELFPWFMITGLILIALEMILSQTILRRIP